MTAEQVATQLGLLPHPEGGFYRETWRSNQRVVAEDGRQRAAGTAILFLLPEGAHSAWHRVASDEMWLHQQGAPLALHLRDDTREWTILLGSDLAAGQVPQALVPAGVWQAARPVGGWALMGCTVSPGFEFEDFEMVDDPVG
jgi:hypothetical protein